MKLKVGDVVQNLKPTYSDKNFVIKPLAAKSVGRVVSVHPNWSDGKALVYVKFHGHPKLNFFDDELLKVRVPRDTRAVQKPKNRRQNSQAK